MKATPGHVGGGHETGSGHDVASPQTRVPAGNRACDCETPRPSSSISAQQTTSRHDEDGSRTVTTSHGPARSSTTQIVARNNHDGTRTVSDQHGTSTFRQPPKRQPQVAAAPQQFTLFGVPVQVQLPAAPAPQPPAEAAPAPAPVPQPPTTATIPVPAPPPVVEAPVEEDPTKKYVDAAHDFLKEVPRGLVKHPAARIGLEAATIMTDPRYSKQIGEFGVKSDEGYSIRGEDGEPRAGTFRR